MNSNTTLTNRNGKKVRARVTYHLPVWLEGRTVCGITLAQLNSQDLRVHQFCANGDLSDANCAECAKGGAK